MSVSANEKSMIDSLTVAGWPRPRAEVTTKDGTTKSWPVPWMAAVFADHESGQTTVVLDAFNLSRTDTAIEDMLCQVCGQQCQEIAYAPVAPIDKGGAEISISGTPVCSLRCAKLALTMCPHFGEGSFIASFATSAVQFDEVDTSFIVQDYTRVD